MASLLVYIELEELGRNLDLSRRDSGSMWQLRRSVMALDRLDDEATLFVCTTDRGTPIVIGWAEEFDFDADGFISADVRLRDHELVDLLPRLGCTTDLATFARPPRVLPPGDVELLRYAMALADDRLRAPPPPEAIVTDDDELLSLRIAVLLDPAADEPRMLYADALQERGDPRGELIALQLAKGRVTPSLRERALVARLGTAMLGPLAPFITGFTLVRGFVGSCTTLTSIPDAAASDPHWRTVEQLFTDSRDLLFNADLRARRLGIRGPELVLLARSPHALPYSMIGGYVDLARGELPHDQRGVRYAGDWNSFAQSSAFPHLRTLSLDFDSLTTARPIDLLLTSRVGAALEHLDFWITTSPPVPWFAGHDTFPVPRLTFRTALPEGPRVLLGFEGDRIVLESPTVLTPRQIRSLQGRFGPLLSNRARIELVSENDPELLAVLRESHEVTVVQTAESLAP